MKHCIKLNIDNFFNLNDLKDKQEEIVVVKKQKLNLKYFKSILTKKEQQAVHINKIIDINYFNDELMESFSYGISYDDETQLELTKSDDGQLISCFVYNQGISFDLDPITKYMTRNIFKLIDENYAKIVVMENIKQVKTECEVCMENIFCDENNRCALNNCKRTICDNCLRECKKCIICRNQKL